MKKIIALWVILLVAGGCATSAAYKEVFKAKPVYSSKEFSVPSDILFKATVKAICSKNFLVEKEDKENSFILANKFFQRGRKMNVLALQAKIVPEAERVSTLYLTAVETTERVYVADRTRFFLFIVPLPGGGGKEATKVKEGEHIVNDRNFYKKFFLLIEKEIESMHLRYIQDGKEGK